MVLCIIFVFTTVLLKFQYNVYFGSHLGQYIPEICVEPVLTDPARYYVQGWEGYFNTIGATTIDIPIYLDYYHYYDEINVTATHLKSCLDIRYSNIARNLDYDDFFIFYSSSVLYHAELYVWNTCKSITQVWHVGL